MIPESFDYIEAHTTDEAVKILSTEEESKLLAGGMSLIPLMKLRILSPKVVVDINKVKELEYISEEKDSLVIGSLTRMSDIEASSLVKKDYPLIHDAAVEVADPIVRNRGTVGGNLCQGDSANDMPAVMLALNANLDLISPDGKRRIGIQDFYLGPFQTAMARNEMLTSISIPRGRARSGSSYVKLKLRAGDHAIVGVATNLALDGSGKIAEAGIGLTSAAPVPVKAVEAERFLLGKSPSQETFSKAADMASSVCDPATDLRGPADYKREMVKALTVRALGISKIRAEEH